MPLPRRRALNRAYLSATRKRILIVHADVVHADTLLDLEARRPVWEALSTLFLDTDESLLLEYRAKVLASSPYTIDELERISKDELFPICRWNLLSVAGEWAGFDLEGLENHKEAGATRVSTIRIWSPYHHAERRVERDEATQTLRQGGA